MKRMNFDAFQRETDISIVKATLTIIDRRTGRIGTKDFYRFGNRFPTEQVGKQLAEFGYDVVGTSDETVAEGVLDFELMFASLSAAEKVEA